MMFTENIPKIDFLEGQTFRAQVPFTKDLKGIKIHIVKVIDEGYGQQIAYRLFGRHKRWWHYFIESKSLLEFYIFQATQR